MKNFKRAQLLSLFLAIFGQGGLWAEDILVSTLSQGACWYEEGENLKISSFNDKEILIADRYFLAQEMNALVVGEIAGQKARDPVKKDIVTDLSLHCGGYGASLVYKTTYLNREVCAWFKLSGGEVELRSIGGVDRKKETRGELCDGYKWGELIVGVKNTEAKAFIEDKLQAYIKSVNVINSSIYRINLKDDFIGREEEVILKFGEAKDSSQFIKFTELNRLQHPVGESVPLK